MEFIVHVPDLDGVGARIRLTCKGWGPDQFKRTAGAIREYWWDRERDPDPANQPDAAENQRRQALVEAAAAQIVDQAGNLAFVYDPAADDHLRIYGLPQTPPDLVTRYLANRPPTEFDWGTLKMQKKDGLDVTSLGDNPERVYSYNGIPVCRRAFAYGYTQGPSNKTIQTVTETPAWARNDGTWVEGKSTTYTYTGRRYNKQRTLARNTIFDALKEWIPDVLVALSEVEGSSIEGTVADIPAGEALSGSWFLNHASQMNYYLVSGRKDAIEASLAADSTAWLGEVVPDGVVPGLASGKTVREMIVESLR